MILKSIGVAVLALGLSSFAYADDNGEKKQTRAEKKWSKVEARYQPTGETKRCVPLRHLRESRILDAQTIFFRSVGKKAYVNRLPRKCPRLVAEERFSYSTTIGQLCNTEIITVIDSMGSSWGGCGLGDFEVWQRKPKVEEGQSE
jgi:hypothetical protein